MKNTRITVTLPEKFLAMSCGYRVFENDVYLFSFGLSKISNDREDISNKLHTNFLEVTLHQAPFIFVI